MEMQRQLAEMNIQGRQETARLVASMRQPSPLESIVGPDGKPVLVSRENAVGKTPFLKTGRGSAPNGGLPTQALKLQQEELDAIGTASSINADLSALSKQIDEGKLAPSLINNAVAAVRNYTNNSTDETRNLASYQATLEKLRNDSLRLNKGVQTEGDSERAWNEIIKNSNDTEFVKKRLKEVFSINERAANLRKMNVDVIRSNYGIDPMDVSGYQNQPSAVGNTGAAPAATGGLTPAEQAELAALKAKHGR
jgi:hypothetical protein